MQRYLDLLRDPRNINQMNLFDLMSFQNVSPVDAVAILKARERAGIRDHDELVENLDPPFDDIEVAVGYWVERSRINDDAFHGTVLFEGSSDWLQQSATGCRLIAHKLKKTQGSCRIGADREADKASPAPAADRLCHAQ